MNEITFRVIDISWTQRISPIFNEDAKAYSFDKSNNILMKKTGFYAIYGHHHIYGQDVLLYIGETKESENTNRTFYTRFNEHLSSKFWHFENISFSLGTVNESLSPTEVRAVESVLIAANRPVMNKNNIYAANQDAYNLLIRNWEFPGNLRSECTGSYWCET